MRYTAISAVGGGSKKEPDAHVQGALNLASIEGNGHQKRQQSTSWKLVLDREGLVFWYTALQVPTVLESCMGNQFVAALPQ